MSEFSWLKTGDRLPTVAVAQILLKKTGASISVDGSFGPKTKQAVKDFQKKYPPLAVDGVIGRNTWPKLVQKECLQIIDCIDVFDFDMFESEVKPLLKSGGSPILIGGMCNGLEQAIRDIKAVAKNAFLIRFHGHGAPGVAGVSDGEGEFEDNSSFRNNRTTLTTLHKLRDCFGPYGCIEFMHCDIAQGKSGLAFLQMAAQATGVAVSGGIHTQYSGNLRKIVRFEGRTRTVCPSSRSLREWALTLPG